MDRVIAAMFKVFLVTTIGICLATGNQAHVSPRVKAELEPYGTNNVLAYDHFGDTMYFTEVEAGNKFITLTPFEVIQEDVENENIVSIKGPGSNGYFSTIRNQLEFDSEEYRTIFHLSPIEDSTKFHLLAETSPGITEPIVTPDLNQPFRFFLKSRYPHEPNAEFSFIPLNVELSYNGVRSNILSTLQGIRNGELGDKTQGFSQLISLMHSFGHMEGSDIFVIGTSIKEDLGIESVPFSELPTQVQLIVSGVPVSLSFWRDDTEEYRMKYETAWNSTLDILPYTFNYNNGWSITFAEDHQLYDYNAAMMEKSSPDKSFAFRFALNPGLATFRIMRSSNIFYAFTTSANVSPFRFVASTSTSARFRVERYI